MGLESTVIAIAPYRLMKQVPDVLDYPDDYYEDVKDDTVIICTVAAAFSNEQSRNLAELCGCKVWDFNAHKIESLPLLIDDYKIGFENNGTVHDNIRACLELGIDLYFQPNG